MNRAAVALVAVSATAVFALAAFAARPVPEPQTPLPTPSPSASPDAAPPPLLSVPDAAEPNPVSLAQADVLVQTVGTFAKTTVTLTFRNNTARILEGELAFPLPEGAAISGYALDVNGEMADAVPVAKEEARVVFETEARKGVDPGLVEQTQGNNFRTRIYPLPANGGTRTVRLSFVSEAVPTKDGELHVTLPVHWNQTVPLMTVRVQSDAPASLTLGGKDRAIVREEATGGFAKTLENVAVSGDLDVRVQTGASQAVRDGVMVEGFTKPSGATETYFAVLEDTPAPVNTISVVRPGRRVSLLWDASLSRRTANIERELTFLQTLARLKWRDTTVSVTILRNTPERGETFHIENGDATKLAAYLRGLPLDGGTTRLRSPAHSVAFDYALAFTDGLETLSDPSPVSVFGKTPVWIVNTDARSDAARLRAVAGASGGDYLALSDATRTDADFAASVGSSPYSLLGVSVDAGKVEGLTANGVAPVKNPLAVAVAGRLLSDSATVTLRYGYPGGKETATRTVTLRQPKPGAASSGLVAGVWAQKQSDALSLDAKRNADALRRVGQEFGIVTPGTSLLVLETLEQCLQYGIAPARTRKALYARYVNAVETQGLAKKGEERSRVAEAVTHWRERTAWWSREFKAKPNLRAAKPAERGRDGLAFGEGRGGSAGAAGAAPAMPALRESESVDSLSTNRAMSAPRPGATEVQAFGRASGVGGAGAAGGASRAMAGSGDVEDDRDAAPAARIVIKSWTPDAPYLKKIAAAETADAAYAVYLAERTPWQNTPAYYFDCADALHKRGATRLAVRVLTGITDLGLEDAALLRIVAHRLVQWGHVSEAVPLFEQVARMRPEEPQSFRDLALAVSEQGDIAAEFDPAKAVSFYNRALVLLNKVATGKWDRFDGISDIAVTEANRVIARAKRLPGGAAKLVVPLDTRLVQNLESDLRVVMTWDSDNSDMDLHVVEPTGEEADYGHNRTAIGGHMSRDFTQGYGPEEYFVRRGKSGTYTLRTNYFGSREQRVTGGTTVQATVYTNWGRSNEQKQSLSLRLAKDKETVTIGQVSLAGK